MWSVLGMDERFLDRRGCGDEFYMDARFKSSRWLAGLNGVDAALELADDDMRDELGFDADPFGETRDAFANH